MHNTSNIGIRIGSNMPGRNLIARAKLVTNICTTTRFFNEGDLHDSHNTFFCYQRLYPLAILFAICSDLFFLNDYYAYTRIILQFLISSDM